jgi:hypothetical protein
MKEEVEAEAADHHETQGREVDKEDNKDEEAPMTPAPTAGRKRVKIVKTKSEDSGQVDETNHGRPQRGG